MTHIVGKCLFLGIVVSFVFKYEVCLGQVPSKARQLSKIYYAKKAYAEAIPFLQRCIKQNSRNDTVIVELAHCYHFVRENEKARKVFQYLEQKHRLPDSLSPLYLETLKQMGQYKEAKSKKFAAQNPICSTRLTYCDSALKWQKKTKPLKVFNMKGLNT